MAFVVLLTLVPTSAAAVDADGEQEAQLDVRITQLTPGVLAPDDDVTISGTVTNNGDEEWTDAQAYLVAPQNPFATRQQITDAVDSGSSYTGERRVELDSIDDLGTLAAGETREFSVRVPSDVLNLSGVEGVYPVGVQILGTAENGTRSSTAIGRATTFLPLVEDADATPTSIVVPFVMPDRRGANGDYIDPEDLVERIAPRGQLRNLLTLATSVPDQGLTVIVDPALLAALDDLAEGRNLPDDVELDADQRADAAAMRDDLVALARRATCWVLGYARPDVLAIERAEAQDVTDAVERATAATVNRFGLSGRRVTWPTANGVTEDLLAAVRGDGERPVLVGQAAVPDWEPRLGSIVNRPTDAGPVPLLVNAGLDIGVPGELTVATLRQRLLSEAALGSLERVADPDSRAAAVAVLDPAWDPGPTTVRGGLADVFDAEFTAPRSLDVLMTSERAQYTGETPESSSATPVGPDQVAAVDDGLGSTAALAGLLTDPTPVLVSRSRRAAELVGINWRRHSEDGVQTAEAFARSAADTLAAITVEGPPAVTLSSSEGSFPITVTNETEETVRVGLQISSTNPSLSIPDVEAVEVTAGERRTLTVDADVGDLSSSTFTATMVSESGDAFGSPAVFNVRSSRVGVAVWVAMGIAVVFVALALSRRFVTRRRTGAEPGGSADD